MYHDITIRPVAMVSLRSSCVMRDVSYPMRRMQYGIRRTQRNPRCFCSREGRYLLRAARCGFTVVELLIVVVIVAIAAMAAIPMMSSAGSFQIRSAANIIAADLEYAKTIAISRGQNFSVVFDISTESYRINDQYGAVIVHPVKKGFYYAVDFRTDGRLSKVDIENVDFDPGSVRTITFDYLGSPYSGSNNPLNSGVISLRVGQMTTTINVEPVTGFISIVD